MRRRIFSAGAALAVLLTGLTLVPGGAAVAATAAIPPVRPCADLVRDFALTNSTAHVTSATVVATTGAPEYCDVRGYVEPAVQFDLRLPTTTYDGRYLQYGCGGFCGTVNPPPFPTCAGPVPGNMAVAATDDGHVGQGVVPFTDGSWAATNQAARDDLSFRAPHVLSQADKQIIAYYYGAPPRHAYFDGCSNGGREGLLLAQRYPHDFEGIVAAAPAGVLFPLMVYQAWLARSNTGADGAPILTAAKLPALHGAVLAACDGRDGLVDGQIDDPAACTFDPASLLCAAGTDEPACLTPAQVAVVRRLYAGPTDPAGRRLYPGGQPYGSELAWYAWLVPVPGFGSFAGLFADNYLKYLGYPIGAPNSSLAGFAFTDGQFDRLRTEGVKADAMRLDYGEFQHAGGKLLIWQGYADQAIPPAGTLDYYQRLWERNGGLARTEQWARVFMVPTVYHCGDGYRLTSFDPVQALVGWVERGAAPDRIVATQTDDQGRVVRSRPVFPYPLQARYVGTGSVDDARNFVARAPRVPPHDIIPWIGTDLYSVPGPVAP